MTRLSFRRLTSPVLPNRMLTGLLPLLFAIGLLACSGSPASSPTPDGSSNTPTGGSTPTLAPGSTPTAPPGSTPTAPPGGPTPTASQSGNTPTGTPAAAYAYCAKSCSKVAECVPSSSTPLTDADNWSCTDSICVGHGCNNTKECTQTYNSSDYACASVSYVGVGGDNTTCVKSCKRAADCSLGIPSMDTDNYACDGGLCKYLGCNNDKECTYPGQVCRQLTGYTVSYCVPGCNKASDCASSLPAYDTDNYTCVDGVCNYTGCNSNQECAASSSASYPLNECHGL